MYIFSANIQKFRKLKSLSVEGLAAKIGVKRQSVYDWETKDTLPRKKKLYKLAEVLGVKVADLFHDEKDKKLTSVSINDDLSDELEEARKLNAEYRKQLRELRNKLAECQDKAGAK